MTDLVRPNHGPAVVPPPAASPEGAGAAPADFAFPPDSLIWRVCRERCNLLDGGAAAVLQVAHPKVGAGVRDHSDFRADTFGRLVRTLDGVNTIAFGTRAEARAMAARIAERHRRVRGRVAPPGKASGEASGMGPGEGPVEAPANGPGEGSIHETHSVGETYSADDPELLMWVIATLVVAALVGYERALPPLSAAEREAFYGDMRRFGAYFGLPADFGPQTWEEFCRYWERMLADRRMGATATSKAMAWAVAAPVKPWWLRLMGPPVRFAFTEVLPSPVRERLGFRRTLWARAAMAAAGWLLPRVVPLLPPRLRYCPQYLAARERLLRGKHDPLRAMPETRSRFAGKFEMRSTMHETNSKHQ